MSLTRKMLSDAGVEESKLNELLDAYQQAIGSAKSQGESDLKAENENLKQQLEAQSTMIEELKQSETTAQETKDSLEKLQSELEQSKSEYEKSLKQYQRESAIKLALKDTDTVDSDILFKLIDMDKVEFDDNDSPKLNDTITQIRESKPYLFQQQEEPNTPSFTVGGNPNVDSESPKNPFQDVIDNYK